MCPVQRAVLLRVFPANAPLRAIRASEIKACSETLVPVEGIEPTLLAEHDFESCASTNSATRARRRDHSGGRQAVNAPIPSPRLRHIWFVSRPFRSTGAQWHTRPAA